MSQSVVPGNLDAVSIGIFGLGSIGARHLRNFANIGVKQLFGYDSDKAKKTVSDSVPGATWTDSLEQMLEQRPGGVVICSPSNLHADAAIAALEAGANVFIEKPIATTVEDASRIVDAAARSDKKVLVGCNLRFHPGVAALKKSLDDDLIGKPLIFKAEFGQRLQDWRPNTDYRDTYSASSVLGGGIILETVHELDYLTWLGGRVTGISGYNARISDLEIDAEDTAGISLRLSSGSVAELHVDYLRPAKRRGCEVIGTNGVVTWISEGEPPERLTVTHFDHASREQKLLLELNAYDHNDQYLAEASHFLDIVVNGREPALDAAGGRDVLKLALDIRDATTGKLESH